MLDRMDDRNSSWGPCLHVIHADFVLLEERVFGRLPEDSDPEPSTAGDLDTEAITASHPLFSAQTGPIGYIRQQFDK